MTLTFNGIVKVKNPCVLNLGANRKNVQSLEDYISNAVFRLCSDEEIKLRQAEIRMRR